MEEIYHLRFILLRICENELNIYRLSWDLSAYQLGFFSTRLVVVCCQDRSKNLGPFMFLSSRDKINKRDIKMQMGSLTSSHGAYSHSFSLKLLFIGREWDTLEHSMGRLHQDPHIELDKRGGRKTVSARGTENTKETALERRQDWGSYRLTETVGVCTGPARV